MVLILSYIFFVGDRQQRWYSTTQMTTGKELFGAYCAACHGKQAQGLVADWKQRNADGALPPPPLNGSAHAWHHAMPLLLEIIQQGGALYDGQMPAFADVLNEQEQLAVVAYFQSYWNDETYRLWHQSHDSSDIPLASMPAIEQKQSYNEVHIP